MKNRSTLNRTHIVKKHEPNKEKNASDHNPIERSSMNLRKLTQIPISAALVFVTTTIIRIPIPATGGYFNLGESIIYAVALLYGPIVGGLAGGIGASIADAIGYPLFTPGTFIIKLFEGLTTGYVGQRLRQKKEAPKLSRIMSLILGIVLSTATYYIGVNYMAVFANALSDQLMWGLVSLFLGTFIVVMGFMPRTETAWQTSSIILGGLAMVAGYFLYENLLALLFPNLEIYAVAEIPANIGQMLVGLAIALPILRAAQGVVPLNKSIDSKPS